jgi:hypothetical protein
MNNPTTDFNEWLDSLGFDTSSPENNTQAEQAAIANMDLPPEPAVLPSSSTASLGRMKTQLQSRQGRHKGDCASCRFRSLSSFVQDLDQGLPRWH